MHQTGLAYSQVPYTGVGGLRTTGIMCVIVREGSVSKKAVVGLMLGVVAWSSTGIMWVLQDMSCCRLRFLLPLLNDVHWTLKECCDCIWNGQAN
jgi:hypothetical protein